jgi:hypothetical protein
MKSALIFLAISATIATALPANACDGVSFFRYANGRCVNLTSMTWMGRAEAKQAGLEREAKPFRYSVGEVTPVEGNQFLYRVAVGISNISANTTLEGDFLEITDNSGEMVFRPYRWASLAPGATKKFTVLIFYQGKLRDIKPGIFEINYNPKKSQDRKGVNALSRDRDEALDRSYPYNIKKEVAVCLVAYCPKGMARTDR